MARGHYGLGCRVWASCQRASRLVLCVAGFWIEDVDWRVLARRGRVGRVVERVDDATEQTSEAG